jgi:pilus assembly protein Flp/PilA
MIGNQPSLLERYMGRGERQVSQKEDEEEAMLTRQYFAAVLRLVNDRQGQDLIEYALMAGFVAVAAGAVMPSVASTIGTIFSQVSSVLAVAASQS